MGDKTGIEWADASWNPTTGCDQTSPGCDNCYALRQAKRLKLMGSTRYQRDGDPRTSGPGFGLSVHPDALDQPLRWTKPRRIFVNSMSDLFHREVPDEFIAEVFAVMACAPQHTFQVLTKRPKRMQSLLGSDSFWLSVDLAILSRVRVKAWSTVWQDEGQCRPGAWLSNVWLGVSVESDRYTYRVDHLRETPAAVRFVSAEPLLGALPSLDLTDVDWLVVGAESGPAARFMYVEWVHDLKEMAAAAGTKLFVKQLSSGNSRPVKDLAGFPPGLRVREYPS